MLLEVKRALERNHPNQFAEFLGDGAQRQAFLFGNYVIKDRCPAWRHDRMNNEEATSCPKSCLYLLPIVPLLRIGIKPANQIEIVANTSPTGVWIVQPYYRPLTSLERAAWEWVNNHVVLWRPAPGAQIRLDVHVNNLGVCLRAGTVHLFDW